MEWSKVCGGTVPTTNNRKNIYYKIVHQNSYLHSHKHVKLDYYEIFLIGKGVIAFQWHLNKSSCLCSHSLSLQTCVFLYILLRVLESATVPRLSDLSPWSPKNRGSDKEENQDKALSQCLRIWLTWKGKGKIMISNGAVIPLFHSSGIWEWLFFKSRVPLWDQLHSLFNYTVLCHSN